ncbi:MAG: rhodanese-like domain-containing protein [Saonia sp.]
MKLVRIFFLLLFCNFQGFGQQTIEEILKQFNTENVPYVECIDLAKIDRVVLLDAREKEEFNVSHLKQAVWVGFKTFEPKTVISKIKDKNAHIVVYCSIGVRSEDIAEILMKVGYTHVQNLYGGIFEWKNQGYPVFDTHGNMTNKVHAFGKQWEKFLTNGDKVYR